jgi:hypothetical protein
VGYDEEVDLGELGETGYTDMKRRLFDVRSGDDSDDDEEMKRDSLLKNGDWINHEAFLEVLRV